MSQSTFKELYKECMDYMECGDMESIEAMDWEVVCKVSKDEIDANDSPNGHYLLATYYLLKDDTEKGMAEKLKAACLGCCVSAIDYSGYVDHEGVDILGIAKAMNEAGHDLASAQEEIDASMEVIEEEGDLEMTNKINAKAAKIKKIMDERSLSFFW